MSNTKNVIGKSLESFLKRGEDGSIDVDATCNAVREVVSTFAAVQMGNDENCEKYVGLALESAKGARVNKDWVITKATDLMTKGDLNLFGATKAQITDYLSRDSKSEAPKFSAPKGRNERGFHRVSSDQAE